MSQRLYERELEIAVGVLETILTAAGLSAITASEASKLVVAGVRVLVNLGKVELVKAKASGSHRAEVAP